MSRINYPSEEVIKQQIEEILIKSEIFPDSEEKETDNSCIYEGQKKSVEVKAIKGKISIVSYLPAMALLAAAVVFIIAVKRYNPENANQVPLSADSTETAGADQKETQTEEVVTVDSVDDVKEMALKYSDIIEERTQEFDKYCEKYIPDEILKYSSYDSTVNYRYTENYQIVYLYQSFDMRSGYMRVEIPIVIMKNGIMNKEISDEAYDYVKELMQFYYEDVENNNLQNYYILMSMNTDKSKTYDLQQETFRVNITVNYRPGGYSQVNIEYYQKEFKDNNDSIIGN